MDTIATNQKSVGGKRRLEDSFRRNDAPPFFSIVTITFNNAAVIGKCIDAIVVQACQDYEFIVVDGGSTDGTIEILQNRERDIDHFISEPDKGIYNAINKGIALCNGQVIGLIHADDLLAFNALHRYRERFLATNADIVLGDCVYVDTHGRFQSYKPARNYGLETIFRGITAAHEAIFIKSSVYRKFGRYDETYRSAADYKLISAMVSSEELSIESTNCVEVYKLIGGESFSGNVEFEENFRLMRERAPHVADRQFETLLKLKNYRDLTNEDLWALYRLVPTLNVPSYVMRALCLSLLAIMLGDGKTSSFHRLNRHAWAQRSSHDDRRTLFCLSSIKGITGGAERVLIDIASNLRRKGRDILVASADGRAGTPYYRPDFPIDLVDIFEPPYDSLLNREFELRIELDEIIDKIPEEILFVVARCKALRDGFNEWSSFANECKQTFNGSASQIRLILREEIDGWLKRHGARTRRWRCLINEFKPAIVVPFMISASTEVFVAARKTRAKVLISNHGHPVRDYLYQDGWDDGLLDRALRLFAIVSSERTMWLQDAFLECIPRSAKQRSVVVPNPIRIPSYAAPVKKSPVILGVGRLIDVKRFDIMIRAFAIAARGFPQWRLHIYGEGPLRQGLQELTVELGIAHAVEFQGVTSYIHDVYQRAEVLVSCSEVEGFGMTVAEALASGLPAVVPRNTVALARMFPNEVCGLHVGGEDIVSGFADAMRLLMADDTLRAKLGKRAQEEMKRYSLEDVVQNWEAALSF